MAALTQPELTGLLRHPAFSDRMVEISEVAHDTDPDAGVAAAAAAYKTAGGRIVLSGILHLDPEHLGDLAATQEQYADTPYGERLACLMRLPDESGFPANSPSGQNLTHLTRYQGWAEIVPSDEGTKQTATNPDEARTSLAIIARSLPTIHRRNDDPRQLLLPPSSDIISSGGRMAVNPGLIEATTTAARNKLGSIFLFLWRAGNETAPARMQALRRDAPATENTLGALGLRTATVVFNRHTGKVRSGLKQLDNLFEPIPI